MIVRMLGIQVWNRNDAILAAIASAQRCTNAVLSDFGIRVVTVVQDHKLYVAKDNLNRVVVGTAFGQIDPVQFKVPHDLPGLARFAGMSAILIQSHPKGGVRIPMTEVT